MKRLFTTFFCIAAISATVTAQNNRVETTTITFENQQASPLAVELAKDESATTNVATNQTPSKTVTNGANFSGFQGYITLGTTPIEGGMWGLEVTGVFGHRFSSNLIGIEVGFNRYNINQDYYKGAYIPIALTYRSISTGNDNVQAFLDLTAGVALGIMDSDFTAFYFKVGLGVDIKRFTIGAGYMGMVKGGCTNAGYINIGVKLGGKTW